MAGLYAGSAPRISVSTGLGSSLLRARTRGRRRRSSASLEPSSSALTSKAVAGGPPSSSPCRLELGGWRTVLVGKNGAGKSLLVEGLTRVHALEPEDMESV